MMKLHTVLEQSRWNKGSQSVLCDKNVQDLKGKYYKAIVRPAKLYEANCWPIKDSRLARLKDESCGNLSCLDSGAGV